MKRILTVLGIIGAALHGEAQSASVTTTVDWVSRAGGPTEDFSWSAALDANSNIAVAGHFTAPADFSGSSLTFPTSGGIDILLAKYGSDGELLWARQAGGPGDDEARGTAIDHAGNIYETGSFTSPATFGALSLTNSADSTFFLSKYTPNGELLWVQQAGGGISSLGKSIAVDPTSGTVVAAGLFQGEGTLGSIHLNSGTASTSFIAKYDSNGHVLWAQMAATTNELSVDCVAVDLAGNAIISGTFSGTAAFGDTSITSYGGGNIFVAKFDPNGRALWARHAGGSDPRSVDECYAVTADFDGNVYAAGYYMTDGHFGDIVLPENGNGDIFLAKYTPQGDLLWVRGFGSSSPDQAHCVATDANGDVYITGYVLNPMSFDSFPIISSNHAEVYVTKFDPTGKVLWAFQPGGSAYKSAYGLAVSPSGTCYVTGFYRGTTQFGGFTLTNRFVSNRDIFLTRVESPASKPRLGIQQKGNEILISWPATATTVHLQSATHLAPVPDWTSITSGISIVSDRNHLTNTLDSTRFYRLH